MENKLKNWLKETIPVIWKEKEYAVVYYFKLTANFAAVIEWEEDFDNEEYYDGCCPCISIRKINSSYFASDWIIPTLRTLSLEKEIFEERLQSITNWLSEELKESVNIFKLIDFKKEALTLEPEESISYEVNDWYIITVTADEEGYNCELLYNPNGVDDLVANVFVDNNHRKEVEETIDYLIGRINNEN